MESQLAHPHGQVYEENPKPIGLHSVVEGDPEEHGGRPEKKSVLKKVKAKARKLRDTITGQGHGHDEDHIPDDCDLDEDDDDEDEEMVEDPEIPGAPMYDSAAAGFAHSSPDKTPGDREKQFDPRREEKLSGRKVETMENLRVDDYQGSGRTPMNTPLSTGVAPPTTQLSDDPAKVFVHGHDDAPKVNLTRPHGLKEDPDEGPTSRSRPPPNYETKVTGPTHTGDGKEANIPLYSSFGEMKIGDKGEAKTSQLPGSHHEFSPETPSKVGEGGSEDASQLTGNHDQFSTETASKVGEEGFKGSSYTGKISSAATAVADRAVATKNLVATKLGYGTTTEGDQVPQQEGGGYTEKISSAGQAITGTAVSAKNLVASKLGYGGSKEEPTPPFSSTEELSAVNPKSRTDMVTEKPSGVIGTVMSKVSGGRSGGSDAAVSPTGQDKVVSVKDYLVEKLKPGEEDKALSKVISSAFHTGKKCSTSPPVVTESEEVKRSLGESGKDEGQLSSPGKTVVETLRGTVGSWFGKSVEPNQTSSHHGAGEEEAIGEKRIHESAP